jgi:LuxR family quorum sensing-dependent transcriptional regulator
MLMRAMEFADAALAAPTAEAASEAFFAAAAAGVGATYLQTRRYRRPRASLTSASHWAAGGFITRIAAPGWVGSPGFDYVCFQQNPLLTPIRDGLTRYRFGDFAPRGRREYATYWEALSEARVAEALCATSYGAGGAIASLHLGFETDHLSRGEAFALQLAGLMLTERLITLAEAPPDEDGEEEAVRLTPRERDSLAWVAEGKSDWEISVILGVAETTVRFHVDNARRKLGAANRAQAIARLAAAGLI